MLAINSLLLLTSTVLAATIPRDTHAAGYELLYNDLVNLDTSVNALTDAVNSYTSGAAGYDGIIAGVEYVNATNRKAYYDALSSAVAVQNLADSDTIAEYVGNPIAVNITTGVEAIEAKKAPLVAAGFRDQIISSLELLLSDHESLSAAISEKLNPASLVIATGPVAEIDAAIRSAIADFEV